MDNWKEELKKVIEQHGFQKEGLIKIHISHIESLIEKAITEAKIEVLEKYEQLIADVIEEDKELIFVYSNLAKELEQLKTKQ